MRLFILLLLITATSGISAQQLLFDKTLPEQNVSESARLKSEMKSHYISSRYVSQKDFFAPQDFFISITSNLTLKSKFVRMHSYPSGSISYEGRLEGPVTGQVTFSKFNDRTAGLILLDDGTKYMIDQLSPEIFTISLSNESAFTQRESRADFIEINGQSQPNANIAGGSICEVSSVCEAPSVIDIMVVYTQQAENSWSGAANTIANITQAVTNMNTSMWNSGINNVTFRLVHTTKVTYTESGDFGTDLSRLSGNGDGYMDDIHVLRDQYGADLVSMVIGSPTTSCGIGYLNTNTTTYSPTSGFNVSLYSCVVGNFTMAHECGHNMGLRHDWYVDRGTSPCSHHHGYVNEAAIAQGTSSPASSRWRTIMAYNDRCMAAGFGCTRINFWSNPNMTYNGHVMGRAIGNQEPSDEAYAYYRMACLVASFRSAAAAGCSAPSGLSISSVTSSEANLSWSAVGGAFSYDIEYKLATSSTWINAMSNTPSIGVGIGGLAPLTLYDWRVRANCSSGSSSFSQSQFTTLSAAVCGTPGGLAASAITTNSVTLSWGAVSGANSYDVDYKTSSSGVWNNAVSGTGSSSISLNNLSASTLYNWRVRANCAGLSSSYGSSQFTTLSSTPPPPLTNCPGSSDVSSNGDYGGAAEIFLNTDIKGTVSPRHDIDHYKFVVNAGGTITVSLTTLPANYNLALLNSTGTQLAVSQNNGTQSESINQYLAAGTYYAKVFPKGNANNATACYTLRVQTGTASDVIINDQFTLNVFPNPADNQLNLWIEGANEKAQIRIYDIMGKLVMHQLSVNTLTQMNISKLSAGVYLVKVNNGLDSRSVKFIKK